jgi:ABC-type lipoprotein export system ATPase subunit
MRRALSHDVKEYVMEKKDDVRLRTSGLTVARQQDFLACLPDLSLRGGEAVAVIGPSGCGKTTVLLALAGIRKPQTGTVNIDDTNLWAIASHARDRLRGRRIGLVFQSFHLVDALSVENNIRLAAVCAGTQAGERVDRLLKQLDLAAVRSQRADRISHGQAQRAAIARALVNRPAVILADEPTSALDDANTESLLKLLTDNAAAENAALVITTHDKRVLNRIETVIALEAA